MSKKTLLLGAIASIIAINSVFADTTVTSKQYVDTTRQATIPAADTNYEANGGGVSVVTYTENAGVLGERYICDAEAFDNEECGNDNLVTLDSLDYAINGQPETTVTYKTCYQEVNGDCILWNLRDKYVYGHDSDCINNNDCSIICHTWGRCGGTCQNRTCSCSDCL